MSIRKRGDVYQVRVYAGVDEFGRSRYAYASIRGTLRDAKAAELQLQAQAGPLTRPSGPFQVVEVTLAEYSQRWLSLYVEPVASPATIANYRYAVRRYIVPMLGHVKLKSLTLDQVQFFVNRLMASPNSIRPEEGTLKPLSVRSCIAILSTMLNRAVKSGLITSNPCKGVVLPKVRAKKVRALSVDEVRAFLLATRGNRFEPLFYMAILTGLRIGELLALRWAEVDLEAKKVEVVAGGSRPDMAKSEAGHRTVVLPSVMVEKLRALQVEQARKRLKVKGWNPNGYVFPGREGGHMDRRQTIRKELDKVLALAGIDIPGFTFHSLRGAHASLLADAGLPIRAIADRLGHTDAALTMRLYVKSDGVQDRVASALDMIAQTPESKSNGGN